MTNYLRKRIMAFLCAVVLVCVGAVVLTNTRSANAGDNGFTWQAGASIRVDKESAGGLTGIRFKTYVDQATYDTVISAGELKAGAEIGMIIMPTQVFTLFENQNTYSDIFAYCASLGRSKASISVQFTPDMLVEDGDQYYMTGVIGEIRDSNLKYGYSARTYYTLNSGSSYTYSGNSDERRIADVADKALQDETANFNTEQKEKLAELVSRTLVKINGSSIILKGVTGESYNLRERYYSLVTTEDLVFTIEDPTIATVNGDVITFLKSGTTSVSMQAYGNLLSSTVTITKPSTVVFNTNGAPSVLSIEVGNDAVTLPTPYKYGYQFTGWYTNSNCSGDPVDIDSYSVDDDVSLYAGWIKNEDVRYVYLNYGLDMYDTKILTYETGDTVKLSDLPTMPDLVVSGITYPFTGWCYENQNQPLPFADFGDAVTSNFTITEDTYLLAVYTNYSNHSSAFHLDQINDYLWAANKDALYPFGQDTDSIGVMSAQFTIKTARAGDVGIVFRATPVGEFPLDGNSSYYYAYHTPNDGAFGLNARVNGAIQSVETKIELADLPLGFQRKQAQAADDGTFYVFTLTVASYEDRAEIYLDNTLIITHTYTTPLVSGTVSGIKFNNGDSRTSSLFVTNPVYRQTVDPVTISFNANGGNAVANMEYTIGEPVFPSCAKSGYSLEGWYYDEDLNYKATIENFAVSGDTTLYAKWCNYANSYVTNSNGTYVCSDKAAYNTHTNVVTYPYAYSATVNFTKGTVGGTGIIFRSNLAADVSLVDHSWKHESLGDSFLCVAIDTENGVMVVSQTYYTKNYYNTNNPHINKNSYFSIKTVALSGMPAWQTKFNAGTSLSVNVKVIDYGTYFEVYVENELCYTSEVNPSYLQKFVGAGGCGIRTSTNTVNGASTISITNVTLDTSISTASVQGNDLQEIATCDLYTDKKNSLFVKEQEIY